MPRAFVVHLRIQGLQRGLQHDCAGSLEGLHMDCLVEVVLRNLPAVSSGASVGRRDLVMWKGLPAFAPPVCLVSERSVYKGQNHRLLFPHESSSQRVQLGIWYILKVQRGSHIPIF